MLLASETIEINPATDLATLDNRLMRLPLWRRRMAMSFARDIDCLQSVMSYELLAKMLHDTLRIPPGTFTIEYGTTGKPAIAGRHDIYISLSHCDRAVMAAVADCPVGCDVEAITTDTAAAMSQTIDYCFSPRERRAILQASDPEVEFIKIWTVKEAVFKLDNDIDIETLDTTALSRRFNIKSTATPAFISTVATLNTRPYSQLRECLDSNAL